MPFFARDNINFHYLEKGDGIPFFFQHGLGGDAVAVCDLIGSLPGFRLLALDCQGHGETRPLGEIGRIGFDSFADDVVALMDHLGIGAAVIGGSSMGAGVALNCALRHPKRVAGLVLQRPAWLDCPRPHNVEVFAMIADLLGQFGPKAGLERFKQSSTYDSVAAISSDSASSLSAQFSHPRALETIAKLERIPQDAPNWDRREWRKIAVPTLVLANRSDPIHPFEYGTLLAQEIPDAEFKELIPKSVDLQKYTHQVRSFIGEFLERQVHRAMSIQK
jgi:pimeloyl-ACP methyl ester carboxylesterase